ncbi:MAG: DUF6797 domain-containing protein [Planctomycetota bacterium]
MRTFHAAVVPALLVAAIPAQDKPRGMDYGPTLMTTFEGGGLTGTTHKGLVVKLGDDGAVAFDTELLRVAAAWTDGWLRLRGTAYDGSHGPMPALRGKKVFETRQAPGWASGGDLADPRAIPHGPLPRSWGQYRGMWLHGDTAVVGYRVGDMDVREAYGFEDLGGVRGVMRTLELGPSKQAQTLVVLDGPDGAAAGAPAGGNVAVVQWQPQVDDLVELAATPAGWSALPMGGPAATSRSCRGCRRSTTSSRWRRRRPGGRRCRWAGPTPPTTSTRRPARARRSRSCPASPSRTAPRRPPTARRGRRPS